MVRTRPSSAVAAPPIVATTHRGRIQVQGKDMPNPGPSYPWARAAPLPKADGLAGLDSLESVCTTRQRAVRDRAFERARYFVQRGPYQALPKPISVHFFNRNLPANCRNARVDIEVIRGEAFV